MPLPSPSMGLLLLLGFALQACSFSLAPAQRQTPVSMHEAQTHQQPVPTVPTCCSLPAPISRRRPIFMAEAQEPAVPAVPARVRDWRVDKARLSYRHSQQILKRRPRFLPYAQACAVAQALGLSSKDEWEEWLELGEDRTPYVPSDPEAVYSRAGTWLGWRAFLTGAP